MTHIPHNRSIYQKLLTLIPNLPEHLKVGKEYGKSQSAPYMDLSYDFLHEDTPGEYIIALHHYFEMNGDLVPDPDMEIKVIPEKNIADAVSFQNQIIYHHVDQEEKHREKLQQDLNEFLDQWLENALAQGHRIDLSKSNQQSREDEIDELRNGKDGEEREPERGR